jgi:hypothetical protein
MSERPECPHAWRSFHQDDFPPEIYWVRLCTICLQIDASELGGLLGTTRNDARKAEARADAAEDYARRLHAWVEESMGLGV